MGVFPLMLGLGAEEGSGVLVGGRGYGSFGPPHPSPLVPPSALLTSRCLPQPFVPSTVLDLAAAPSCSVIRAYYPLAVPKGMGG